MESEGNKELAEKLRLLLILQTYDQRIKQNRQRLESWPNLVRDLDTEMENLNKDLEKALKELNDTKFRRKELEAKINDMEVKIKKKYLQLYEVKSNKDYQQMLEEIDEMKAKKSKIEDQVLELMEQTEAMEVKVKEKKAFVASKQTAVKEAKKELQKEMETLKESLERLERERHNLSLQVDPNLLSLYTKLMELKGAALSPVIKGVCQLCHLSIPPQKFIELLRCQTLMSCPNCERIIYWGEDELFANID
jgi:predicted  nucleic acid-binding Zn-ribbon protein